jgi:FkbM family methyltransferase
MIKNTIKELIKRIPINFTKNQRYDSETISVINKICTKDSNCIDVGAHKGEVLDKILSNAPEGNHFAFEPIPFLYENLKKKYSEWENVQISNVALSDKSGETSFNYVVSNPSYSGLIKRKYDRENESDETIKVTTGLLDNIAPAQYKADFIKIDVEGGEFLVLQGAKELIKRSKPTIIFEHGLGASDYYGTKPEDVYNLLDECGLKISLMQRWLNKKAPLTIEQFKKIFDENSDYYFIAYP